MVVLLMWVVLLRPLIPPCMVLPMIHGMYWIVWLLVSIARQCIEFWVVIACEMLPLARIALISRMIHLALGDLCITQTTTLGHTITLHSVSLLILILAVLLCIAIGLQCIVLGVMQDSRPIPPPHPSCLACSTATPLLACKSVTSCARRCDICCGQGSSRGQG
jgi:hypothetical protein